MSAASGKTGLPSRFSMSCGAHSTDTFAAAVQLICHGAFADWPAASAASLGANGNVTATHRRMHVAPIQCANSVTWRSCGSSYQMVWPPWSSVRVFLASGCRQGCRPFTLQYHTCSGGIGPPDSAAGSCAWLLLAHALGKAPQVTATMLYGS